MPRPSHRTVLLVVALAARATAGRAGEPEGVHVDARIDYDAPTECPRDTEFAAQVQARAPRLRRVQAGEAQAFSVRISRVDAGYRGELTSSDATGAHATREVMGDTCAEVAGALGLVLALTIDPNAPLGAMARALTTIAAADSDTPARAAPPAANEQPPRAGPARSRDARDSPPFIATPSPMPALHFAAGVGATSIVGLAVDPMFGGAIFVEARFPLVRDAGVQSVRLAGRRAESATLDAPGGGTAQLTWTAATLDVCPLSWGAGSLALSPCARVDVGVLAGSGANVPHPSDDSRSWFDAGALARGRWDFAGPFFADLEVGAVAAVTRPRFHFDVPDITIRQPAPVLGIAALHVGGRFP